MTALPNDYDGVLAQVRRLDADAQRRLLQELTVLVEQSEIGHGTRSLRELSGLGKEIWQDIDVDEYIRQEREAWLR
ncbi:MAG: hypothetical protein U0232_30470 [Thermomicrobiales bacterium]